MSSLNQQLIQAIYSIGDFYEGKQIVIRYDMEVDKNTIQLCGSNSSQRCIDEIIRSNEQKIPSVGVRCVFLEEYNPYLQGLNREFFPLNYPFTLTLEGDLENIDNIVRGGFSNRGSPGHYDFTIENCRVINVNQARKKN